MRKKISVYCLQFLLVSILASQPVQKSNKNNSPKGAAKKKVNATKKINTAVVDTTPLFWYSDVMKADSVSKKTSKPIFGFFTGSDWCGWCHKLQREVFAKPDFIKWAKEKVVLLELDFPRRKQLPQELQQQNQGLAQAFQIQGYPTVWLFTLMRDSSNNNSIKLNALGSLGYPSEAITGKEEIKFLENANSILANKTK